VAGIVHVRVADVAPVVGDAQARSDGLSKVPFLLKSIHPHNVAFAVTPASETVELNVVPAAPNEIGPLNPVVPSSTVMVAPVATAAGLVVGLRVPV
jgi:hypothetical protein